MGFFETLLFPFVWALDAGLDLFFGVAGSMGPSLVLLSLTVWVILIPLRNYASTIEKRILEKTKIIDAEKRLIDPALKGESRFLAVETIYEKNGYHPLQSIGLSASLMITLPVLIAAVLVLDGERLAGFSFLLIKDLGVPDGLVFGLNLLPVFVLIVTILDAAFRYGASSNATKRFIVIALLLMGLIYYLPAGLVLYWLCSNLYSAFYYGFATKFLD